ncbi:hypothetical protein [Paenibacillus sp. PL91]|nr:hypothetical protein [Paenibacillus sp. PL91]MBC9204812.1 hypothetical protein [Paenibacillus sp. PL91]
MTKINLLSGFEDEYSESILHGGQKDWRKLSAIASNNQNKRLPALS